MYHKGINIARLFRFTWLINRIIQYTIVNADKRDCDICEILDISTAVIVRRVIGDARRKRIDAFNNNNNNKINKTTQNKHLH